MPHADYAAAAMPYARHAPPLRAALMPPRHYADTPLMIFSPCHLLCSFDCRAALIFYALLMPLIAAAAMMFRLPLIFSCCAAPAFYALFARLHAAVAATIYARRPARDYRDRKAESAQMQDSAGAAMMPWQRAQKRRHAPLSAY